jgi:hypothetical protein
LQGGVLASHKLVQRKATLVECHLQHMDYTQNSQLQAPFLQALLMHPAMAGELDLVRHQCAVQPALLADAASMQRAGQMHTSST